MRPLPVYDLSLLKDDGTWGRRLRRSTIDCLAPLPALFAGRPRDGSRPRRDSCRTEGGDGYLRSGATTMSNLASMLSNRMRTVSYAIGPGSWAPSDQSRLAARSGTVQLDAVGFTGFVGVHSSPMIEALREQLGLRVEPGTGPVTRCIITEVSRDAIAWETKIQQLLRETGK